MPTKISYGAVESGSENNNRDTPNTLDAERDDTLDVTLITSDSEWELSHCFEISECVSAGLVPDWGVRSMSGGKNQYDQYVSADRPNESLVIRGIGDKRGRAKLGVGDDVVLVPNDDRTEQYEGSYEFHDKWILERGNRCTTGKVFELRLVPVNEDNEDDNE